MKIVLASLVVLFVTAAPVASQSSGPELVWTHADDGVNWIGYHVALGNHGTQVFAHPDNYAMHALLLSAHDTAPPTPVWIASTYPADPVASDSAREADVHASLCVESTGVPGEYEMKLHRYSSAGLQWTYTFPEYTIARGFLAVSTSGDRIVAAVPHPTSGGNHLLVFGPDSPTPLTIHELPTGTIWSMQLATGGAHLILGINQHARILAIPSGTELASLFFGQQTSSFDLALSGDGSVFLHGGSFGGKVGVRFWNGDGYVLGYTYEPLGADTNDAISCIEVSDDGTRAAVGISEVYPSTKIRVEAFEIGTGARSMREELSSSGKYQNHVADLAMSADGSRFAVATFGDEPDLVDEVRVYAADQDTPLFTLNLPGSAFNVDMSADGLWVVAGSKGVHANELGHGGRYDLIHLGGADLRVTGTPSVASAISLELYGEPGDAAFLLLAPGPADPPVVVPFGTLYLDPATLWVLPLGAIPGSGAYAFSAHLPSDPVIVGATLSLQGATTPPKHLGHDWVPLTLLP